MSLNEYFRLYEKAKTAIAGNDIDGEPPKRPRPFLQWIALFLGVLTQPFFSYFKEHGSIEDWGDLYSNYFLLFGLVVAIIVFPSVYRSSFDVSRPRFLQIIPIFTAGLGWQTMVDSVMKGASAGEEAEGGAMLMSFIEQLVFLV